MTRRRSYLRCANAPPCPAKPDLPAAAPLRVAIVADDPLVRAGLATLLSGAGDLELVPDLGDANVVLWDAGISDEPDAAEVTTLERRGIPILALVGDDSDASLALAAGARGVVQRNNAGASLVPALRAVQYGLTVLDPAFAELAAAPPRDPEPPLSRELTAREQQVLGHLAAGLSNKRIARLLAISEHTVKFHINGILDKLDADSRTQAVVRALRRGLVTL